MGLFDSIKKVVSGVVEGDPDKVIEGASEAVEDTKEVVDDVVSGGTAAATTAFSAATGAIADPGGTVRDAGALLSEGVTAAANTVADSLDAAPTIVTGVLSHTLEGASDLKGTIESTVGAALEPISEPLGKTAAALTAVIQEPIETAGAVLEGVKSGAEPLLGKVGDTIEKVANDPVDFVESVTGGIVGGLGTADLPGAGREVLREGVIEPIVENEQFGAIADAVTDPAGTIGLIGEGAEGIVDLVTGEGVVDIDTDITDGTVGVHVGEAGYSAEVTDDGLELGMQIEGIPDITLNPEELAEDTIEGAKGIVDLVIGEDAIDIDTDITDGEVGVHVGDAGYSAEITDEGLELGMQMEGVPGLTLNPGELAEDTIDGAERVGEEILDTLVEGARSADETAGKVADKLTDKAEEVGEKVGKAADKVAGFGTDKAEAAAETAGRIVGKVEDVANEALAGVEDEAASVYEKVEDITKHAIEGVEDEAASVFEKVEDITKGAAEGAGDFGSGVTGAEGDLEDIQAAGSEALKAADELGGQFRTTTDAVIDGMAPPFTAAILGDDETEDDLGFIEEMAETVSEFIDDAVEAVGDAVEAVTDFVEDLLDSE